MEVQQRIIDAEHLKLLSLFYYITGAITCLFSLFPLIHVLMGFGLESDAIHSPNENFPLEQFFNGIQTIPYFYKYYSEMEK